MVNSLLLREAGLGYIVLNVGGGARAVVQYSVEGFRRGHMVLKGALGKKSKLAVT
jgi:hypothetical protein